MKAGVNQTWSAAQWAEIADKAAEIVAKEAMEAAGVVSSPEHNGDRTVLAPPPPR